MLRVLTLSSLFPDASRPNFGVFVERQTLGLAAHPDVALTVVAPLGVPPWPLSRHRHYRAFTDLPEQEVWKGVEVLRPRFAVLPGTGGRYHVAAMRRAVWRAIAGRTFDVIDASFFFPDGPVAVGLGLKLDLPVSIKARGADIHHWGRARATAAQVVEAGKAADGLLAVSRAMREDMKAIGIPSEKIRVHHTGVDLARFVPLDRTAAKTALGVSGPLVVSVGALIARKGHDVVIDAVARLDGVTLLIAGEGEARQALEARIARLGLGERVRLLGSVPHDALPALIAAADVMALASSSEGLANAWVEALACGTPIVITPAGGAEEVVTAPEAGRVVPREAGAFAAAIGELLAAPPSVEAVRAHALGFTWEANTAALHEHLAGLVTARQARG
ncbi:glycosyltransferase family 4 protein [Sphingomonas sp. CL5.1]|uniref:glycosyltransferase n=1 Tax=Sphingomonas sp. CL5.1 TaxID=2653203 RepID=UPI0015840E2F|nr:glycosyltransferase [Sphingomonas sp. CL5.1]QKS01003.1 glycosyltransferase family 4 protein [Sphingomonas sp. CL5.1]